MDAEKRKILEEIHDLLKGMPQDCLGTGRGVIGLTWPIRDEVMDNLCKVMAEEPWITIDPEDESTWPERYAPVNLRWRQSGRLDFGWRLGSADFRTPDWASVSLSFFAQWKPASVPEPPEGE